MTLATGLLTYWPLNEASGDRADLHSNGYTLTEVGSVGTAAGLVYPAAAVFAEGADNYLTRALAGCGLINFNSTTDFTIAVWAYPTSFNGGPDTPSYYKHWINLNQGSYASGGWLIQTSNAGQVYVMCGKTGGPPQFDQHVAAPSPSLNAWSLFVWTHTAATQGHTWYLNGSPVDSDTNAIAFTAATGGALSVGIRTPTNPSQNMAGRLGPIAIWGRPLSAAEVVSLYNGGAGLTYAQLGGKPVAVRHV